MSGKEVQIENSIGLEFRNYGVFVKNQATFIKKTIRVFIALAVRLF